MSINGNPRPVEELIKEEFGFYISEQKNGQPIPMKKEQKTSDKTIALQILEATEQNGIVLFHNQYKDGFVSLTGDGSEILRLRSKQFLLWLSNFTREKLGQTPSRNTLQNVIQVLEGNAIFNCSRYDLYIRIAEYEGAIWYDLADGKAVRITKDGWEIVDKPPILFQRVSHQVQQIHPLPGEKTDSLRTFINIRSEEEYLLFLVCLISYFIPNFPHPIMLLYGSQGAGKTTPLRLLKLLIDPSHLRTLSAPDNLREFIQIASHHYFFFLDNLSYLPNWLSDALARAVTGDGFSKRELYTDDDDIIYSFQRNIGLNGINQVVQKADLLDRSILIGLERITKDKRRTEKEFWAEVEKRKQYILGGIFDVVAGALREHPKIHLNEHPRMADFAEWGCAIAIALGYSEKDFLTAYYNNINKQNDEAIEASPVGMAVMAFMENKPVWEGESSELLRELEQITDKLKINTKTQDWPKSASSLSRRLQLIHSNLVEQGIMVTRDEKSRPRKITIQKVQKNADESDGSSKTTECKAIDHPAASVTNAESANYNADGNSEGKFASPTVSTTPTAFPYDIAMTIAQELRAKHDLYASYFPTKELSDYTNEDLRIYSQMIKAYNLDGDDRQPNRKKYAILANEYKKEMDKREIKIQSKTSGD